MLLGMVAAARQTFTCRLYFVHVSGAACVDEVCVCSCSIERVGGGAAGAISGGGVDGWWE